MDPPRAQARRRHGNLLTQWTEHADRGVERTWGFTVDSRIEQMLFEIDRPRAWFAGKVVLDAGCGNGYLTEAITTLGAESVGIDYSDSVMRAQAARKSARVHFVRGDLQRGRCGHPNVSISLFRTACCITRGAPSTRSRVLRDV